jgi:hypothetical protein
VPPLDERDLLERVAGELKRPVYLSADFEQRVMAAVRAARPRPAHLALWEWLTEPRTVAVSPLTGLAAAAAVGALLLAGRLAGGAGAPAPVDAGEVIATRLQPVQLVLHAPAARQVAVAGDFNGWDPSLTPLARVPGTDLWAAGVLLAPGRYTYSFVVDGRRFVADPSAPRAVGEEFGAPSSVLLVGAGSGEGGGSS